MKLMSLGYNCKCLLSNPGYPRSGNSVKGREIEIGHGKSVKYREISMESTKMWSITRKYLAPVSKI